jgi:hypothetical protein
MLDRETRDKYERIANMLLAQVSQAQIAQAVNLSDGRLSQIIQSDEFKQILERCGADYFERQRTLNEAWDVVEEVSLTKVVDMLRYNQDPDYLLKAAMMANRAQRRGTLPDQRIGVLDPNNGNGRAVVIQLNQMFVQRLDRIRDNKMNPILDGEKKQQDILPPARVEQILDVPASGSKTRRELRKERLEEIDEMMDGQFAAEAVAGE